MTLAIIKKVKEKISLKMTKRTKPESISLLGSALNPFAKDLTFLSQKDRETAHKLLRDILMPLNVTLKVANEVDQPQEENPKPQEDNPPKLPFLSTLEDSRLMHIHLPKRKSLLIRMIGLLILFAQV